MTSKEAQAKVDAISRRLEAAHAQGEILKLEVEIVRILDRIEVLGKIVREGERQC